MAKVSEVKFEIKGVDYKINVNCTSSGEFNMNIPSEVATDLRISDKLTALTLSELTTKFDNYLKQYKSIQTTHELFIIVAYQAKGKYIQRKDGFNLFYYDDPKYRINVTFGDINNAIGLDFLVAMKETIDGKEKWFKTELNKDGEYIQNKYGTHNTIPSSFVSRGKVIPFNQQALDTLNDVQEKFRSLSENLFNFINQDEENILLTLTNNKLLN